MLIYIYFIHHFIVRYCSFAFTFDYSNGAERVICIDILNISDNYRLLFSQNILATEQSVCEKSKSILLKCSSVSSTLSSIGYKSRYIVCNHGNHNSVPYKYI